MERVFSTVASPFSADVETAPDSLQLELIDLQADNELQMTFKHSDSLVDFYKLLPAENFIHLRNFAAQILCVFGSTYICEQAFFCLNQNKSKNRNVLSNANVQAIMRVSTTNIIPDLKKLVQNCGQLHLSH